jgi:hypothetical protein
MIWCHAETRREPPPPVRGSAHVLLITLLTLAACTSTEQELIERGYPPDYAEGYEQGCASGKAAAGGLFAQEQKDESRYQASDSQYAQGWDAGYAKCVDDMRTMVNDARTRKPSRDK